MQAWGWGPGETHLPAFGGPGLPEGPGALGAALRVASSQKSPKESRYGTNIAANMAQDNAKLAPGSPSKRTKLRFLDRSCFRIVFYIDLDEIWLRKSMT